MRPSVGRRKRCSWNQCFAFSSSALAHEAIPMQKEHWRPAANLKEAVEALEQGNSTQADYASLLRQCGIAKAFPEGKRLHAQLIRSGKDNGTLLGNLLVQMYGKCGSPEDARAAFAKIQEPNVYSGNIMITAFVHNGRQQDAKATFDRMPQRNVVSWNSMVAAYAQNGQLQEARQVFDRMAEQDLVSCNLLIQAYAREGQLEDATGVFSSISQPDSIAFNTMLVAYAQEGQLERAKSMFDRIPEQSVVSWNAMIQAFAQNGYMQDAKSMFDRMPQRNVVAWTAMMAAYAHTSRAEEAKAMFDEMPERDFISWNALLGAYARNGHLHDGTRMLDRMPQHNSLSWNAVIQGYVQKGNSEYARSLFDSMPQRDIASCNIMIQASGQCGKLEDGRRMFNRMPMRDVVSWTTMITGYSQSGQIEQARQTFDTMPERNAVSWNTMINAYSQNGFSRKAVEVFRLMDMEGVRADKVGFASALDACSNLAALQEGKLIHSDAVHEGLESGVVVGTALVNMYGRCGQLEAARSSFDKMPRRDVVTWTALFAAYAHSGHAKDVVKLLFPELELEGTRPDSITLLSVLSACSHAGLLSDGRGYFLSLEADYGILPMAEHFVCMIDLLGRGGQLDRAEELIHSMPFQPDSVAWTILLAACRIHKDVERAERAAERILELDPGNAAPYVQLLNVYDAAGQRDSAAKVKKLMEERGIKRLPGWSSIETNDTVHEFTVGDRLHPRCEEIYAELRRLGGVLKSAGYVPDTKAILHDVEEEAKEDMLGYHSEKLAIALGLIATPPRAPLNVVKNLRVCHDCHTFTKFVSKVVGRKIVVRDSVRFHHVEHGVCSCGDYW